MKKIITGILILFTFSLCCGFTNFNVKNGIVDYTTPSTEQPAEEGTSDDEGGTGGSGGVLQETPEVETPTDNGYGDIMGDGYQFGDELIKSDATIDGFFTKVYRKYFAALSGFQKLSAGIFIFFFIIATIMAIVSFFGNKSKIVWYLLAMLVSLILLICCINAGQIAGAFINWWNT